MGVMVYGREDYWTFRHEAVIYCASEVGVQIYACANVEPPESSHFTNFRWAFSGCTFAGNRVGNLRDR
jgi:hypothetical protein